MKKSKASKNALLNRSFVFVTIIFLLLLSNHSIAQSINIKSFESYIPKWRKSEYSCLGKIKAIKVSQPDFEDNFGQIIEKSITSTSLYVFNERFHLIEVKFDNGRGIGHMNPQEYKFDYDDRDNLIRYENRSPMPEWVQVAVSKYDNSDNLVQINRYAGSDTGTLYETSVFKYDSAGNMIERVVSEVKKVYSELNINREQFLVKEIFSFKYDGNNNQTEKKEYSYSYKHGTYGSVIETEIDSSFHTYRYDNRNNLIEEKYFINDGVLNEKKEYSYDSKGNLIEIKSYNLDLSGSLVPDKYDTAKYIYDENSNLIEDYRYRSDMPLKYTYEYEYDDKSNWTVKRQYNNNILKMITRRTIEYQL